MTPQDITRFTATLAKHTEDVAQARGAIAQIDADLLSRYGVASPEEGEAKLLQLQEQLDALTRKEDEDEAAFRSACREAGVVL